MVKMAPYHTNSPEYSHREVFHDHDDCPDGKRIRPEHKVSGIGARPLCDECINLERGSPFKTASR
jgi:hypothetical protein